MVSFVKKILVPLDGSKKSLKAYDQAINLAKLTDAQLTVINVIPHVGHGGVRTKEFDKQTLLQGKAVVHNADKIAKKKGISIKTKILRGWPGIETVKFAKQGKFDHIVMSTTGTGGAPDEMFGSVSNYVTHKAKIPIYLVK